MLFRTSCDVATRRKTLLHKVLKPFDKKVWPVKMQKASPCFEFVLLI